MKYRDENGQWQDILLPATGDTYPIGSMAPFAGIVVPTNWLKCDGSQYNKSDYPELYKVIGDTWNLEGDNDDTKFRVPDMSERAAIGATNEFPVGTLLGEKEHTLTPNEIPDLPIKFSNTSGQVLTKDGTINTKLVSGYSRGVGKWNSDADGELYADGGGQAHNNIPPSAATMYIIKAKQSIGIVGTVSEDITDTNNNAVPTCETVKKHIQEDITTDGEPVKAGYKVDDKDVYVKRVNVGNLPNAGVKQVPHGLNILDITIIKFEGTYKVANNTVYLNINDASSNGYTRTNIDNENIYIATSIDRTNFSGAVNIYFTNNEEANNEN